MIVPLAQWIARWTSNPKVLGSTPRWDDTKLFCFIFIHEWSFEMSFPMYNNDQPS